MKKLFILTTVVAVLASVLGGCSNDSQECTYYPNAIVTVKTAGDGTCYLQLDNNTTVLPTNVSSNPFKKQVRAYTYLKNMQAMVGNYSQSAEVAWMDSVLTKSPVQVPDGGPLEWGYGYGDDPVNILNSWATVLEDNYLTLVFRAYYSVPGNTHYMNLVYGSNPSDPYEVIFTHDASEDETQYFSNYFDGTVAFDLAKIPGLTSEKSAELTVKYMSPTGERSVTFSYPGNSTASVNAVGSDSYAACAVETVK